jgi:hypothetical protein
MLSRGHRLASVCLRCRRDLARRAASLPPNPATATNTSAPRRNQSSAAAALIDDTYDEPEQSPEAHVDIEDEPEPPVRRKRLKVVSDRSFKPVPTAGIGVESLGKPSEIIVLSPKDRRIPGSIGSDDAPQQSLAEVLEEAKTPAPWAQVKEHIEGLRPTFGKDERPLTDSEWRALRYKIRSGFSTPQLHRYIRESGSWLHAHPPKTKATDFIIGRGIWGYRRVTQEQGEDSAGLGNAYTEVLVLKAYDRLLWSVTAGDFDNIAAATHTSITKPQSHKVKSSDVVEDRVKITGTRDNVAQAKKLISARQCRSEVVKLKGFGSVLLAEDKKDALEQLLKSMGAEHGVSLRRKGKGAILLRAWSSNVGVTDRVRRDLRSVAASVSAARDSSVVPALDSQDLQLMPCYPDAFIPWSTQPHEWGRLHGVGVDTAAENSEWSSLLRRLGTGRVTWRGQASEHTRTEFSAHLGLNLHHIEHAHTRDGPPKDVRSLSAAGRTLSEPAGMGISSCFVDNVPMLAQLLASLPPYHAHEGSATPRTDGDTNMESIKLRLVLKPVSLVARAPTIEVYLRGRHPHMGLRQPLTISRVAVTLKETSLNVAVTQAPIDVSMVRQLQKDIYVESSFSDTPMLLEQMNEYLAKARNGKDELPNFSSFVSFRIPSELHEDSGRTNFDPSTPTEYVLSSADTVRYQLRSIPLEEEVSKLKTLKSAARPHVILECATFKPYRGNRHEPAPLGPLFKASVASDATPAEDVSSVREPSSRALSQPASVGLIQDLPERQELRLVRAPHDGSRRTLKPDQLRSAYKFIAERIAQLGRDLGRP